LQNGYYYDDFRITPLEANSKAFVYDPFTWKLMSTLDENNFATFYEYDAEGNLIRTKKETEKGIVTLSETRSTHKKN
jgi:YD repeat-containing protein